MDNTGVFYTLNVGSIPARRAKKFWLDLLSLVVYNIVLFGR